MRDNRSEREGTENARGALWAGCSCLERGGETRVYRMRLKKGEPRKGAKERRMWKKQDCTLFTVVPSWRVPEKKARGDPTEESIGEPSLFG